MDCPTELMMLAWHFSHVNYIQFAETGSGSPAGNCHLRMASDHVVAGMSAQDRATVPVAFACIQFSHSSQIRVYSHSRSADVMPPGRAIVAGKLAA